jgi:putative redox protein
MQARASREADKEPALWEKVDLTFHLFGDIQPEKAHKAVELSMQKYCSVAETLRRAGGEVTWTITLN